MNLKIKLKTASVEVEYEGSEEFFKQELPTLLAKFSGFGIDLIPPKNADTSSKDAERGGVHKSIRGTTATIASKLGCTSGRQLIVAAAAHLTFVAGHKTFSRQELLDEIKGAAGYYKVTYRNNLSGYLQRLIKDGKLLEASTDSYCLSDGTKNEAEAKLAH